MVRPDDPFHYAARRLAGHHSNYDCDPIGFVRDVLKEAPWSGQQQIFNAVRDHRHVAVQACFGPGKSWTAARLVCWWLSVWAPGDAFAVTTAPTYAQVRAILWREIGRAHRKGGLPGRVNTSEWWIGPELVGFGRSPQYTVQDLSSTALQGIHAPHVLAVIDEAAGVHSSIFQAVEGLCTTPGSRILAIGNPDDPGSEFAKRCQTWHRITISAFDTPNLTGEQVPDDVAAHLVSPEWVEERRRDWGEESPLWQSRVLGLFPETAEDALFPLSWVQQAVDRDLKDTDPEPLIVSCDVARYGADKTVIGLRRGPVYRRLGSYPQTAITEVSGRIVQALREHRGATANVDEVGVGAGVVDSLIEQKVKVRGLNAGSGAHEKDRFVNARAEWYWGLREAFEDGLIDIADDPDLISELCSLKYRVDSRGRIAIESKDDARKRGVKSPDNADCLMMAFARIAKLAVLPPNPSSWGSELGRRSVTAIR
jgi:phage terminase large subunit